MTSRRSKSSASYAYYSFPPTPDRNSPSEGSSSASNTPSPQTARTSKSMAPSPAAGKAKPPITPTKKNPASSTPSKLGQSQSAADSPQGAAKQATDTKNAAGQAKGVKSSNTGSPSLPPRPPKLGQKAKGAAPQTPKAPAAAQKPVDDTKKGVEDKADDKGIDLKDNDPGAEADNEDTDTPVGKVSQAGNETGEEASSAVSTVDDEAEDTVEGAKDTAEDTAEDTDVPDTDQAEDTADTADEAADEATDGVSGAAGGLAGKAKEGADGAHEKAQDTAEEAEGTAGETAEGAEETAEDAEDKAGEVGETAEGAEDKAGEVGETAEGAEDAVGETAEGAEDAVGETAEGAEDAAGEAADGVEVPEADGVEEVGEGVTDELPVDLSVLKGLEVGEGGDILGADGEVIGKIEEGDPEDLVGKTIGEDGEILDEDGDVIGRATVLPEKAQELADKAKGGLPDVNVLDGLEVGEGGEILGPDGTPLGKITEGNPEDLVGMTLNENGEIVDEDGDVIGRAEVVPGEAADKLNEAGEEVEEGTPDELNEAGEEVEGGIPDEVPEDAADFDHAANIAEIASGLTPDLSILQGKKINKKGKILDEEGEVIGQLTDDSDPKACAGKIPNEDGEILDKDGNVVGKVEVVPGEAADAAMKELHPELVEKLEAAEQAAEEAQQEAEIPQLPGLDILEGLKVNKKGEVLNEDGEPIARVSEGEITELAGKKINANGEVLDKEGNVIGKVELIPEAFPDVPAEGEEEGEEGAEEEGGEEEGEEAAEEVPKLPGMDILEGLKVNKKGEVVNEDGDAIAKLVEGDLDACKGKKINADGEVIDAEGNVIGKVELIPEAFPEAVQPGETGPDFSVLEGYKVNKNGDVINEDGETLAKLIEGDIEACKGKKINPQGEVLDAEGNVIGKVELIPEAFPEAVQPGETGPDFSVLEGYKVNKNGDVVNEDGETLAKLVEGDIEACKGKNINPQGEVLDAEGNVIGKVELAGAAEEEETGPELPPLSTMEGMRCNKSGKIVNDDGDIVGELIEGDAKKLNKMKAELDDQGQFFDKKGKVIGRAVTLPIEEHEEESPFAGLEGLVVVDDGWVEDENQNKVGIITEGDPKKLIGRAVDEDGDVIDTRGNVVGHAERYDEPEAEEEAKPDLSILKGLAVNKQGNVIGPDGVPIARLVEGNAKELAGKKCDEEGQLWNDSGKVIGRCELIPDNEREAKPEGPFAGLEGCVVVQDAFVEDEDNNRVGIVVEGDAKRLIGRAVDEDGDVIDKHGNVIGHAEPYEEPEVEAVDLSSLDGKVVNKAGNVVDEHGTIFGRIAEGNPEELAGRKVDGQGQIWSDNGKVIGQAELLPGGGTQAPEGAFAGFENLVVADGGMVTDGAGQIVGKLDEDSMPNAEKLLGRKVDEDGEILDKAGNSIGKAVRWKPEEKERHVNPMSGHVVNSKGEVRDENGELLGMVTDGHLPTLVGCEVDDNGFVVDNDGNKIGECTLIENLPEDEEYGPTEEELQKAEDAEIAKKMNNIVQQTIEKMQPVCKNITDRMDKADRTPKEELDEEELVKDVKPMIEEGNRILQECNGSIRGLDPDGHIAANAKARAAAGEATPQENALANSLKELTSTIVQTIENAKKKLNDMPHAKKELNPLWGLLTEPLFQIIAAVGLLLSGVLGLVGKLLNGLGLGGIVNGLLGGLGIDKLLGGLGLGSIGKSLGLGGGKKK